MTAISLPYNRILAERPYTILADTGVWIFRPASPVAETSIVFSNCSLPDTFFGSIMGEWKGYLINWSLCDWITSFGRADSSIPTPDEILDYLTGPTRIPGPCSSGGASAITIYTGDSTLESDRTVQFGAYNLTFNGPLRTLTNNVFIFEVNGSVFNLNSTDVFLGAVPPTNNSNTTVLSRNTATGRLEVMDVTSLVPDTLYTADGSLPTDRAVDLNGHDLQISSATGSITLNPLDLNIGATTINLTVAPSTNNSNNLILSRNSGTGVVELVSLSAVMPLSFYTNNGSLTSNRTVDLNGFNLTFTSPSKKVVFNQYKTEIGSTLITLTTAPATNNSNTLVLSRNAATGDIELVNLSTVIPGSVNIYTSDGTLNGPRYIDGDSFNFVLANVNTGSFGGAIMSLDGSISSSLSSPYCAMNSTAIGASVVANSSGVQLDCTTSGNLKFQHLPNASTPYWVYYDSATDNVSYAAVQAIPQIATLGYSMFGASTVVISTIANLEIMNKTVMGSPGYLAMDTKEWGSFTTTGYIADAANGPGTTTGRFRPPADGWYQISAQVVYTNNSLTAGATETVTLGLMDTAFSAYVANTQTTINSNDSFAVPLVARTVYLRSSKSYGWFFNTTVTGSRNITPGGTYFSIVNIK